MQQSTEGTVAVKVDLNRIAVFIRLCELGSFTKTAQVLKQPKSRVSRTIAALEAEVGVPLIYRTTRKFQLTDAGRRFLERCREPFDNLTNAIGEASTEHERIAGLIRVTAPDDIGTEVLPRLCERFLSDHPDVRFELVVTNQFVDLVQESVDVAIRIGLLRDSTLRVRRIGSIRSGIYASSKFLTKHGPPSIDTLIKYPCLTFSPIAHRGVWNLERRGERRTVDVDSIAVSSNVFAIRAMTVASMGLAVLPEFVTIGTDLVRVMKDWQTVAVPLQILTPAPKNAPIRVRAFVDFISKELDRQMATTDR
ncbi:MAG: LysR family transcriptional regulator [Bdellovibrionaceae bacterium]|nr:LysR family transcriptional regulator [Pseudobdellovibrionaceae bacterium]